jgi:hypothetical protein
VFNTEKPFQLKLAICKSYIQSVFISQTNIIFQQKEKETKLYIQASFFSALSLVDVPALTLGPAPR